MPGKKPSYAINLETPLEMAELAWEHNDDDVLAYAGVELAQQVQSHDYLSEPLQVIAVKLAGNSEYGVTAQFLAHEAQRAVKNRDTKREITAYRTSGLTQKMVGIEASWIACDRTLEYFQKRGVRAAPYRPSRDEAALFCKKYEQPKFDN
jgi:hypothetical protein